MIAAIVVSIVVKILPPKYAIVCGVIASLVWIFFLFFYWYAFVVNNSLNQSDKSKVKPEAAPKKDDQNIISWKQKIRQRDMNTDHRLPVTIITGYLGSGKTTLVKNILNNTVGMAR